MRRYVRDVPARLRSKDNLEKFLILRSLLPSLNMRQPTLFEHKTKHDEANAADYERVVEFALGEFQARGKVLAERDLPLDRIRGALKRAFDTFGVAEIDDEEASAVLSSLGAQVRRVPSFVAKHPFRVIVSRELAERSHQVYQDAKSQK